MVWERKYRIWREKNPRHAISRKNILGHDSSAPGEWNFCPYPQLLICKSWGRWDKTTNLPFPAVPGVSDLHEFLTYHQAYIAAIIPCEEIFRSIPSSESVLPLTPSRLPCLESQSPGLATPLILITLLIFYVWDPASPPFSQAILNTHTPSYVLVVLAIDDRTCRVSCFSLPTKCPERNYIGYMVLYVFNSIKFTFLQLFVISFPINFILAYNINLPAFQAF